MKILRCNLNELKMKYKYIEMIFFGESDWNDGRYVFKIKNRKHTDILGTLTYSPEWRQWVLWPKENTQWSGDCLLDVNDFIKQLQNQEENTEMYPCALCHENYVDIKNGNDICFECLGK